MTSATTTTVLGNVKVAMLFLFSRVLFGETKDWSWQMLGGAVVALVGFALYSGAKLRAMRKSQARSCQVMIPVLELRAMRKAKLAAVK